MEGTNSNLKPPAALTAVAFQDHLLHDLALENLSFENPLHSYSDLKSKMRKNEMKRRQTLKNIKPTIDTGRTKKSNSLKKMEKKEDEEYVLDSVPKSTLAQRLGLVAQPDKPLTDSEWSEIKERSIARDDFKNPCAICQDYFAKEDQVLLSCSHVFHRACIKAFERFTGKKCCPMCRKIQYQTRVVHEGTKAFKIKAATKIQSIWRGYVVHKWYKQLRKTVPPKNPDLRRRYYEDKLKEITDRMVAMTCGDVVDRFLEDIDSCIASSRAVFQHFEDSQLYRMTDDDWLSVEVKALQRDDTDCPICLRTLRSSPQDNSIALLSCTHTFHSKCLEALEEYCMMDSGIYLEMHQSMMGNYEDGSNFNIGGANSSVHLKCPVCRSLYVKRVIQNNF